MLTRQPSNNPTELPAGKALLLKKRKVSSNLISLEKKYQYRKFQLFIRAFKKEKLLEVWVKEARQRKLRLVNTYDFCATSGDLGPKRKEGDLQIPEGVYTINHFNPLSNFHLSLGINYPNASDKILSDPRKPGGADLPSRQLCNHRMYSAHG